MRAFLINNMYIMSDQRVQRDRGSVICVMSHSITQLSLWDASTQPVGFFHLIQKMQISCMKSKHSSTSHASPVLGNGATLRGCCVPCQHMTEVRCFLLSTHGLLKLYWLQLPVSQETWIQQSLSHFKVQCSFPPDFIVRRNQDRQATGGKE